MVMAWVGNIGSGVSWSSISSFGSVGAVPQVVVGVEFLLVAP